MTDNEDRDEPAPNQQYPLASFIEAIEAASGHAGTQDVADHVGCSYDLAYQRLRELTEEGRITSERVGNSHLWKIDE